MTSLTDTQQLELSLLCEDVETSTGGAPFRAAFAALVRYCHEERIEPGSFGLRLLCEMSHAHTAACILVTAPHGVTIGSFACDVLTAAAVPFVAEADEE